MKYACITLNILFFSISIFAHHPLWVGHECTDAPRTPGIQGSISKQLIGKYLPKNPIVVEAGACHGNDTAEMATLWKGAKVYAFEPVPSLFREVEQRTKHLRNVKRFQMALADVTGETTMYVSSGRSDASSSLLKPKNHLINHPDVFFKDEITVKTITLDDWAAQEGVDNVDMLWLDMQGSEFKTLLASPHIMRTVKVILTEAQIDEQYEGGGIYAEYKAWLQSQGFVCIREDMPWKDGGDALFVRK